MKKFPYLIIFLIVGAVTFAGSSFTQNGFDDGWYQSLTLPSWTPPGAIIGVVWTTIYVLTAVSVLLAWNALRGSTRRWPVVSLFAANAVLNVGWSYLFFTAHSIGVALAEMLVLEATVVALVVLLRPTARWAAVLLYPYAAWVAFATYLTYTVWRVN